MKKRGNRKKIGEARDNGEKTLKSEMFIFTKSGSKSEMFILIRKCLFGGYSPFGPVMPRTRHAPYAGIGRRVGLF